MRRSGKSDETPNESSCRQVSIEDYISTRDSVVTRLATLQSSIQDLSRAYIAHTNTVITKGSGSPLERLNLTFPLLGENALLGARISTPGRAQEPLDNKRKKRAHDKNAPKRPVTSYFLYMQTARSQIASEMDPHQHHTAKEVADEGTRRWNDMPSEEKEYWSCLYGVNFARYKQEVEAYKAGRPIPEISDVDAKKLFDEEKNRGLTIEQSHSHVNSEQPEDHLESEISVSTSSEESQEPLKAPTPPRTSKRQKNGRDQHMKRLSIATQLPTQAMALDSSELASPILDTEKKIKKADRKRDVKQLNEAVGSKDVVPADMSSSKRNSDNFSKSKKSKRKRKSEVFES